MELASGLHYTNLRDISFTIWLFVILAGRCDIFTLVQKSDICFLKGHIISVGTCCPYREKLHALLLLVMGRMELWIDPRTT